MFNDLPIKKKLVGIILLTSFSTLLLACLSLFTYEVHSYKQATVRSLSTIGEIIATNSTAILLFDDPQLARETLGGLRAEPEIIAAALYDKEGKLFATYPTNAPVSLLQSLQPEGAQVARKHVNLYIPVVEHQRRVGMLVLQVDLSGTYRRLTVYGMAVLGIVVASGILAAFLSNLFQRRISQPLLDLAATARDVSERKDYSVRAIKTSNDELGYLTEAFNSMLNQIQLSHAALGASEARLSAVFQQAGAGIALTDLTGKFLLANERYAAIMGRSRESLLDLRLQDVTHPEDTRQIQPLFDDLVREGKSFTIEKRHLLPNGKAVWVRATLVAIRNEQGRVESALAVTQDITEQREANESLKRARDEAVAASRAKDDFLAALSHELRTPLNPVLLLASEGATNPDLPLTIRQDFATISKNILLEARLIDDLLDLTAITRGKLILEQTLIDVHNVLQDALVNVRDELAAKNIVPVLKYRAEQTTVVGDAVRLQQVFWNILKNAVKFTGSGGRIIVESEVLSTGDEIIIRISDTGIGMTQAELDHIFNAFAQGEHASAGSPHRFGGLGLGLAISRELIHLHGGQVYAVSEGRDKGSTFIVELPLAKQQQVRPNLPAVTRSAEPALLRPVAARKGRVLLVEDHEPTRVALERLLRRRGYDVITAESVAESKRKGHERKFDLLLCDIGLPDGTGYEVIADLREQYAFKAIALTGHGMEEDIQRSQEAGFFSHLTKPVRVQSLEQALLSAEENQQPQIADS